MIVMIAHSPPPHPPVRPGLDIVVPILIGSLSPRAKAFQYSPLHPQHPDRLDPGKQTK